MASSTLEKQVEAAKRILAEYDKEQAEKRKQVGYREPTLAKGQRGILPSKVQEANNLLWQWGKIEQARSMGARGSDLNRLRAELEFKLEGGTQDEWQELMRYEKRNRKASKRASAGIKAGGRPNLNFGYEERPKDSRVRVEEEISPYIDYDKYIEQENLINENYFGEERLNKLREFVKKPPLKEGYVYYDEGGVGDSATFTTEPTEDELFYKKVSTFKSTLTPPEVKGKEIKYFTIEELLGGHEDIRQRQIQRIAEIEQITDPVEKAARFEIELPVYKQKADEYRLQIENYQQLFRERVEKTKAEKDWSTPEIYTPESFKLDELSNVYNKSVVNYNKKAQEIISIEDPVERQARIEEELSAYEEPVKTHKAKVDKFIEFYNQRVPESIDIGEVPRTFKGIFGAKAALTKIKQEKLKKIQEIKDPIEREVIMEQDFGQFENLDRELDQYKKAVNIETTQQLDELNIGSGGVIGGPTTPADSPTGTQYVPLHKNTYYPMSTGISKDPLGIAEDYFKTGKMGRGGFPSMKMPKLNRRFF